MREGPVTYEVVLTPDPSILGEFDLWLEGHVAEMLKLPGFDSASIHRAAEPGTGRAERVVRYQVDSREALDRYFAEHAPRMRAEGVARFGARFSATRRIIEEGRRADATPPRPCANCGVPLHGQYCSDCGQRARQRMITFWELVRDAGDLLASLDSRLWRTLGLLMFRPGQLTLDYLQGRRARYVAPLRLFIASSLIFFFVATVNTRFEVGEEGGFITIDGDGAPAGTASPAAGAVEGFSEGDSGRPAEPAAADAAGSQPAGNEAAQATPETAGQAPAAAKDPCKDLELDGLKDSWAGQYFTEDRAREICRKIASDHGAGFGRALLSNLPTMMFFFLPFMAVVMKLLYPLSGRYYAEHLLFLVHYHAFFYIASTIMTLAWWLTGRTWTSELPAVLVTTAFTIYLPVYLFRAMRRVYDQGVLATLLKYVLLGVAYFSALTATLLALVAYTALTL